MKLFTNVSPKAHGAWLGAGAGTWLGRAIIGLIQAYWIHKALPLEVQSLIMGISSAAVAYLGAWLAPLINPAPAPTPAPTPAEPTKP